MAAHRLYRWIRIGPMMPSEHPVEMLAESLARVFKTEMADICPRLSADEHGLTHWLRGRKQDNTAFLLAIDQFEELFTFADPESVSGSMACFRPLWTTRTARCF